MTIGSIVFCGCQREKEDTVFTALTQSYGGAKDYVDGAMAYWSNGDNVRINDRTFSVDVSDGDRHRATINAEGVSAFGGEYYAAYPADIATIDASGSITFDLPGEETYTTVGGNQVVHSVMAAKSDGDNTLLFQNICSLLHFKVKGSGNGIGAQLQSVEVDCDRPLWGTVTANYSNSQWQVASVSGTHATTRVLRFDTPLELTASEQDLYLVVTPVSGATTFTLRMVVEDDDGTVKVFEKTRTGNIAFAGGVLCHFSDVNVYDGNSMKYGDTQVDPNTMDGSENNPYVVYSGTSWNHIATSAIMGTARKHITLASDIEVANTFSSDFKAILDGNGHTITLTAQNISLFSTIDGGTVKNLTVNATSDATAPVLVTNGTTNYYYGALAGRAISSSTFENCVNKTNIYCNINSSSSYVGGLLGQASSCSLTNCVNEGNIVTNASSVGGIVAQGSNCTAFEGCKNKGNIDLNSNSESVYTQNCGGVAGILTLSDGNNYITDCHNYGNITLTKASLNSLNVLYVGGVFGQISSNISNCSNSGTIACTNTGTTNKYIGGIIGRNSISNALRTMSNCYSEGDITAISGVAKMYTGGLVGKVERLSFENCYAYCDIAGNGAAGIVYNGEGLFENVSISNCYFYGTISSTNGYGIAGSTNTTYKFIIDHCYYPSVYTLCLTASDANADNATLSSGVAITGGNNSLMNALNSNRPNDGYSWKNSSDGTHVVFDI